MPGICLLSWFYLRAPCWPTWLAMIFGMLPLAMALGEGTEQRAPMGRAVMAD